MAPLVQVAASATEQQWLYSRKELSRPPSVREGMKLSEERRSRQKAMKTIWKLKDAMQLKQATITTAATLMHRFYMRESFQKYDSLVGAIAAVFLACKSEEEPKSLKQLAQYGLEFREHRFTGQRRQPEQNRPEFGQMRTQLTLVEEAMLNALGFDLTVRAPHWIAVKAAKRIWRQDEEQATDIARAAWTFLNDALYHPLYVMHRPNLLATAALVLACAQLALPLPPKPPTLDEQLTLHGMDAEEGEEAPPFVPEVFWLDLLDVRREEVEGAVNDMLDGYKLASCAFVREQTVQLAALVPPLLAALSGSTATAASQDTGQRSDPPPAPIEPSAASTGAEAAAAGIVAMEVDPTT
ncbi:hypothetical protein JCM11251_002573 [Rhodosporidiobolus azoricus]